MTVFVLLRLRVPFLLGILSAIKVQLEFELIEVPNSENVIECVAPEALTYDNYWCGPGFEYYPQVSKCKLSDGTDKSF